MELTVQFMRRLCVMTLGFVLQALRALTGTFALNTSKADQALRIRVQANGLLGFEVVMKGGDQSQVFCALSQLRMSASDGWCAPWVGA